MTAPDHERESEEVHMADTGSSSSITGILAALGDLKVHDASPTISADMPMWFMYEAPEIAPLFGHAEAGAAANRVALSEHTGTHVDAPFHYGPTSADGSPAQSIDELPLEWFHAPGVVLDMTAKEDGDAMTAAQAEAELARVGHDLRPLDIVLVRTGRDRFYAELDYIARGPGVTAEATHWLFERGVRVMGIDAWGWDAPLHLQDFALTPTFAGGSIRRLLPRLALRRGLNQKGLFTYAGRPKPAADAVKRAFRR